LQRAGITRGRRTIRFARKGRHNKEKI